MLFADLEAAKNHFTGLTPRQLEFALLDARQPLVIAYLERRVGLTQTALQAHYEAEEEARERKRREPPALDAEEGDEDGIADDDIPF